jgi:DNA-binding NtrC family response regulator
VVEVPPLRERPADVGALARHFLAQIERSVGARQLAPEAMQRLLRHPWPGNARELRNVVQAAAVSSAGPRVELPAVVTALARVAGVALEPSGAPAGPFLEGVLAQHRGNVAAAARALGIPRSTLRDRLRAARVG